MKNIIKKVLKVLFICFIVLIALGTVYLIANLIGIKGEPSTTVWNSTDTFDQNDINTLTKADGEDYRILLLSDVQIGSNIFKDIKAINIMDEMIKQTNPDFIMTSGDNSYLIFADLMTKIFVDKLEDYDIPWGVVLGNHDSEGIADRNWHGNQYENAENCLFEMGPDNIYGVGNYVIDIVNTSNEPIYSLIMMDSNVLRRYEEYGRNYDYIHPDQIEWYEWAVNNQKDIPSLLFFHIPLLEFAEAQELWEAGELEGFGENRERICSAPVNSGMFDKILDLDNTTNIFVGHDHVNSLSVVYEGVRLTYGLKTGPACYADSDMQGATMITIKDGTNEVEVEHLYYED